MNTDPIADLLTRIRNAQKAEHAFVNVPYSKMKEGIVKVMKAREFITDYKVKGKEPQKELEIALNEEKVLTLRRVSKPGQRIYSPSKDLKMVKNGLGINVISTSKGIMTNAQAKKENLGGEVICQIY